MEGPLAGVRVADFTWAGVGGYCGLLWAMLGAEVIKIETKVRGGTQRASNPARRVGVKSNLAEELSRDKKSVLLNLKTDAGVRLAKELVSVSDMTAENFRPGVMDRLGLGYQDLVRARPDIVMVSMAANGQSGPDRGVPGYAGIFGALSGLSSLMGYAGGPPAELRLPADMLAGTMGAIAGVAGLYRRRVTGQGQYIDCANRESLGTLIGEYFIAASVGCAQTRTANEVPGRAPYNCYRCADDPAAAGCSLGERERWLAIGITRDEEWPALCRVLALTALGDDADLATAEGRWARRDEIDAAVAERTRSEPAELLESALQAAGVSAGVVMRPGDLLADTHLGERGKWQVLERDGSIPWITFGVPMHFKAAGESGGYAAPPLGADSMSVLTGLLGYSETDVIKLQDAEVVALAGLPRSARPRHDEERELMSGRECLLVMDYQAEIVARYDADACISRVAAALETARTDGTPVAFVQAGFRPGYPEVSPRNRAFSAAKAAGRFLLGDAGSEIDSRVAPLTDEPVVIKHRVGAFWATELEQLLRAQDIERLVLAGIATSGVVLSTIRDAADRDYELIVLSDCCADSDPEVHRLLLERVFPRQARVITSAVWVDGHTKRE